MVYGDDYVAPIYDGVDTQASFRRMAAELERISFELELAAEMEDEPQAPPKNKELLSPSEHLSPGGRSSESAESQNQ